MVFLSTPKPSRITVVTSDCSLFESPVTVDYFTAE